MSVCVCVCVGGCELCKIFFWIDVIFGCIHNMLHFNNSKYLKYFFSAIIKRSCSNIKWKSLNNTYSNIIKLLFFFSKKRKQTNTQHQINNHSPPTTPPNTSLCYKSVCLSQTTIRSSQTKGMVKVDSAACIIRWFSFDVTIKSHY